MTFERRPRWCAQAEQGLAQALGRYGQDIRAGVDTGPMELWQIDRGRAWLVTECRGDTLIAWCFQGSGAREMGALLLRLARANRLALVEFETAHRGLGRLLRPLGFDLVSIDADGLYRYQAVA